METLVLDSLTRFSELMMDDVLAKERRTKPLWADNGTVIAKIKKIIWDMQGHKINTIFTALEKEITDVAGGIIGIRPALLGQLVQAVPAILDVVGYMYIGRGGTRMLSVNPSSKWYAKHRTIRTNHIETDLSIDEGFEGLKTRLLKGLEVPITLNVLIYGPPGVGKTTWAATASGKTTYVDCEGGALSISNSGVNSGVKIIKALSYNEVISTIKGVVRNEFLGIGQGMGKAESGKE